MVGARSLQPTWSSLFPLRTLLPKFDQAMDAAAYRDALELLVLLEDAHWHPMRRVQVAALGLNPGIGHDRQTGTLEQHCQHHFHLLEREFRSETSVWSGGERQILVRRSAERCPTFRLEAVGLLIQLRQAVCHERAEEDH